jgi:transglutaminase-like putative cysteine protease
VGSDGVTATLDRGPGVLDERPPPLASPASEAAPQSDDPVRGRVEIALALLTVAALLGFHRVFDGWHWVGPVIGTALGVQLVCAMTRRWVRHPLVGALIDLAAAGALTAWTVLPSTTTFGVPAGRTWHTAVSNLSGVGARMDSATVPVHPLTGFVLLATIGAGLLAVAGSWLVFRLGRAMSGAVPSICTFATCCALGTRAGRTWSLTLVVVGLVVYLVVQRADTLARRPRLGASGAGGTAWLVRAALPATVIALVVALVAVPALPATDGQGSLGWRTGSGDGGTRSVISPLVTLSARLLRTSTTPVFTVRSTVASYWRLTSLDYFDGTEWNAHDLYQGVKDHLPGATTVPRGARVVTERFDVQHLSSVWLPLAFNPETVTGAGTVSYDPRSGSLLTPRPTSNGLDYEVTSLQYLATLSPHALEAVPPVRRNASLAPYLQLPASIPANVRALAHQIVAGKTTEYARALALQEYFYGPAFTYSLDPPPDNGPGGPLEDFLFRTRTGYCQQFAGSYAVLARAIGLPTRLAIGFTTGTRRANGEYQVTDADAHTWPEVWFPKYGWLPFEPTKGATGSGFAIPGATRYTGPTASTSPTGPTGPTPPTVPTTTPSTIPTSPSTTVGSSSTKPLPHGLAPAAGGSQGGSGAQSPRPAGGSGPHATGAAGRRLAVVGVLLVLLGLFVASNRVGRRWRWSRRRRRASGHAGGVGTLGVIWQETTERLAWQGTRRRASETPREFADRVGMERRRVELPPIGNHLHRLADILTEADFAPGGVTDADLEEADLAGRRLASILTRERGRRERTRLLLDPRLAWAPLTVDPAGSAWLEAPAT